MPNAYVAAASCYVCEVRWLDCWNLPLDTCLLSDEILTMWKKNKIKLIWIPKFTFFHFVKVRTTEQFAVFIVAGEESSSSLGHVHAARCDGYVAAIAADTAGRISATGRHFENTVGIGSVTECEWRRSKDFARRLLAFVSGCRNHFAAGLTKWSPASVHHGVS